MKHNKHWVLFAVLTAAIFLSLSAIKPYTADAGFRRLACGHFVAGSYAATLTDENTGEVASQWLITFFNDHTISTEKSTQESITADSNGQHGTWKCIGRREVIATTLDLGLSDSGIARLEYWAVFAGDGVKALKVKGTIELILFFDSDADPFSDNADRIQKFSFTGNRVQDKYRGGLL